MSASYFLSPHVHLCVAGKQVVLLDLERDKYLAVARAHPVGRWVRGWPALPAASEVSPDPAAAAPDSAAPPTENRLLAQMIAQRVLVTDPTVGKEAAPIVADEPKVALVEPKLHERPTASLRQFWRLVTAHTTAKWLLKHRPIKEVVEGVRLRKRAAAPAMRLEAARPLVAAFCYLRPLLYSAHNSCLLDSLTLMRFLAAYGFHADWVFGVKTDPFYAHCWVQKSGHVFNDSPDHVGEFAPILIV